MQWMTLITTADSRLIWVNSRLCGVDSDGESMYQLLHFSRCSPVHMGAHFDE